MKLIDQMFIEKKLWQYFYLKWPPSNKKEKFNILYVGICVTASVDVFVSFIN